MKMFLVTLFGGWFGLHKFMTGKKAIGFLYLFTLGFFGIGWIVDTIVYFVAYIKTIKVNNPVDNTVKNTEKNIDVSKIQEVTEPFELYEDDEQENEHNLIFKVSGVTFKNGNKTRQAILRAFRWGDEIIETITFEPYLFEGNDAVYVKLNDHIIGNVPSNYVDEFLQYYRKFDIENVDADVYGGAKGDDENRKNYGCTISISFKEK